MINNLYEPRILVTIELRPGAYRYGETKTETIKHAEKTKNGVFYSKSKFKYRPLEAVEGAQLKIKMTNAAYYYFIGDECPPFFKPYLKERKRLWKKASVEERLKAHLQQTCEQFNGISYSYSIIDE